MKLRYYKLALVIILTAFATNVFAAKQARISPWVAGTACASLMTGLFLASPTIIESKLDTNKIAESIEAASNLQVRPQHVGLFRSFVNGVGETIVTGPTFILLKASLLRTVGYPKSLAFLAEVKDWGLYTIAVFSAKGLNRLFFSIPHEVFLSKSNLVMKKEPSSVLFLDLIPKKNRLDGYPRGTFDRIYSEHPNAHFIKFSNLDQLKKDLAQFKGRPFDRIEIFIHGKPGVIETSDESNNKISTSEFTSFFNNLGFSLSHSATDLRMISCSLLNGPVDRETANKISVRDFLKSVLPYGGQAIGASKSITVFEFANIPEEFGTKKFSLLDAGFAGLSYFMGAEIFRTIIESVLNLNRNYIDTLKDIKAYKISDSGEILPLTETHN